MHGAAYMYSYCSVFRSLSFFIFVLNMHESQYLKIPESILPLIHFLFIESSLRVLPLYEKSLDKHWIIIF